VDTGGRSFRTPHLRRASRRRRGPAPTSNPTCIHQHSSALSAACIQHTIRSRTCKGSPDEGGDPAPTSNRICIHPHSSASSAASIRSTIPHLRRASRRRREPAPTSNRICIHQHSSAPSAASIRSGPAKGLPTKEGTRAHEQPHLHSSAFICVICGLYSTHHPVPAFLRPRATPSAFISIHLRHLRLVFNTPSGPRISHHHRNITPTIVVCTPSHPCSPPSP
jgi:hypothetical protein